MVPVIPIAGVRPYRYGGQAELTNTQMTSIHLCEIMYKCHSDKERLNFVDTSFYLFPSGQL